MNEDKTRITLDLSNGLHDQLEDYAERYEMSKSAAIRSILSQEIKPEVES